MRQIILLLGLTLLTVSFLLGQGVTTASISGIVTTQAGEPLPGANIVAVHEPSGTVYGSISRIDGRYNLVGLRVGGPYTITVSYVGYAQQRIENVILALGQNLELNFRLAEQAVQLGEVEVIGERAGIINAARTGPATNVLRQQIEVLPTISRSFQDYYKLSPYFVGYSAAGRNNRYNNIQIDGANYNDLFGLGGTGAPAGQANVTPISLEAIEEFQIVIAPYDVRQSGFTGGGVNVITRSGTNRFSGSAFYYGRNQNFIGRSPDTLRRKYPDFTDYQAGFRIGGPILRNRIFFFVNGELTRYSSPLNRVLGAPSIGTNIFTLSPDSVRVFREALKSRYGYETGSFEALKFQRHSNKLFVKLDFNLAQNHRLTIRHSYLDAFDDNAPSTSGIPSPQVATIYAENTRYAIRNRTNSTVLQLRSLFGNNIANEFIVGYTYIHDDPEYYGQAFPYVSVRTTDAQGRTYNLAAGSEKFRMANELKQRSIEITNNLTFFVGGGHAITVGTHNEIFSFSNLFIRDFFGAYHWNSLADFLAGRKAAQYELTYSNIPGNPQPVAKWKAIKYGVYVQDEWTVRPGLRLTYGLRLDVPTFPDKPAYNYKVDSTFKPLGYDISTDKVPKYQLMWGPRFGINWDVLGDKTLQLRGGVGLFTGRVPYVWISNQYSNTGVEFGRLFLTGASVPDFVPDPYNPPKGGTPVATTEINVTSPNYKLPQVWRASIGIDKTLFFGFIGSIEAQYTKTVNDILYQDINLIQQGYLADGRPIYGRWNYVTRRWDIQRRNTGFTHVILLTNTTKGYAYNIVFQLERPAIRDGFYAKFAYNYGVSRDLNSGTASIALSQWRFNHVIDPNNPSLAFSSFDYRHRILTALSYRQEIFAGIAVTLGLFYNGLSGQPYSWVYSGDVNGDGQVENDLVYIPKNREDVILVDAAGNNLPYTNVAYDQLNAFIESDPYLSKNRGKFAERMAARGPWSHQVDARLAIEIPTIYGQKLEITFDVLNLTNLLNKDWGLVKAVTFQRAFLLTFHSLDPTTGKPRFRWTGTPVRELPLDLASRWQAQIGIKYTF
ncbi:MAG: TonB-dependent receptor [Candidatus Kryptonium sp.]